jgi:hypothetical protein
MIRCADGASGFPVAQEQRDRKNQEVLPLSPAPAFCTKPIAPSLAPIPTTFPTLQVISRTKLAAAWQGNPTGQMSRGVTRTGRGAIVASYQEVLQRARRAGSDLDWPGSVLDGLGVISSGVISSGVTRTSKESSGRLINNSE